MNLILANCRVFDGHAADAVPGQAIRIEDGIIREIGDDAAIRGDVPRIDVGGRFVMPGLIDAHVHAYGVESNPARVDEVPPVLRGLRAKLLLEAMLQRGFTSVRDAAGGDRHLAVALEAGLIHGPRFFYPGLALSQTGGHGDLRSLDHADMCACAYCGSMSAVVDGPDEMRRAVREQLRRGAHHIKLFVSGGVLSPSDPIWMNQFSLDEIRVAVEEAAVRRTYVMAHAHTNEAALRCVELGVRSIEHATMLEESGAQAIAAHDAFAVPTLSMGAAIRELGPSLGLSAAMLAKSAERGNQALSAIERLRAAGAKVGFGTDLLGAAHSRQSGEFRLRREASSPLEILRSATSVNAALLQMEGRIGTLAPDAFADILVVDGDPREDITTLENPAALRLIMKGGTIARNSLD
jgi:imidazolonepropionase-like amidohydrolase